MPRHMVVILYTSAAIDVFPIADILACKRLITPDDYLPVTQLPTCEMTAKGPSGIIEELLEILATAAWKDQLRRSLVQGDIVVIDGVHWMLIKTSARETIKFPEPEIALLPSYKDYCLIRIPKTQITGDLCVQLPQI